MAGGGLDSISSTAAEPSELMGRGRAICTGPMLMPPDSTPLPLWVILDSVAEGPERPT